MSKKFSIVQLINLNKIHTEINDYILQTGCSDPYLFMNEKTLEEITKEYLLTYSDSSLKSECKGKKGAYSGYRVFVNNDLKFGTVEIR